MREGSGVLAGDVDIAALASQQAHQHILKVVGILIFVDQQIAQTVLVDFQQSGVLLQQEDSQIQQIVKIHGIKLAHLL